MKSLCSKSMIKNRSETSFIPIFILHPDSEFIVHIAISANTAKEIDKFQNAQENVLLRIP